MKAVRIPIVFLICLLIGNGAAQERDSLIVSFSDPSEPGTVKTELMAGSITVKAHNSPDLHIITTESEEIKDLQSRARSRSRSRISVDLERDVLKDLEESRLQWGKEFGTKNEPDPDKVKGLNKIQASPYGINVEEDDNVIEITLPPMALAGRGSSDLLLLAPKNTSLQLSCMGGEVYVEGVNGEIEIEAMGGSIVLKSVSGAVVANTMGDIEATIDEVDPDAPMSFSTFGGDIDVTLPGDIEATVILNSHGDIYTDFDTSKRTKRKRVNEKRDEGFHLEVERVLEIPLNGGGSEIEFSNFTGNIYLRKGN